MKEVGVVRLKSCKNGLKTRAMLVDTITALSW